MFKRIFHNIVGYPNYAIFIKKTSGAHNILDTGFIAAANHTSYFDIWAMCLSFYVKKRRYMHFIAKKSLVKDGYTRILKNLFADENSEPIFIDQKKPGKESFDTAIKLLKKNHIIAMYPEGKRSGDGKIGKGKTGAVRLAIWSQKPIVPIGISGAYEIMPSGKKFPSLRKKVSVHIGKPIYFETYYNKKLTKPLLRKLTNQVMEEIKKLIYRK